MSSTGGTTIRPLPWPDVILPPRDAPPRRCSAALERSTPLGATASLGKLLEMSEATLDQRLAVIEKVLAAPPHIHAQAPSGVWSTRRDCYEFTLGAATGQ